MDDEESVDCEKCGHNLFELEGEWHCPACDSISGFELTPDQRDEFQL